MGLLVALVFIHECLAVGISLSLGCSGAPEGCGASGGSRLNFEMARTARSALMFRGFNVEETCKS